MLSGPQKHSHTLRFTTFLLRVVLGLNFAYLGLGVIFSSPNERMLGGQSLYNLYNWLATFSSNPSLKDIALWLFLIVGICLIAGLLTRFAAIIAIALTVLTVLPVNYWQIGFSQAISSGTLIILSLIIVFITNAGTYFGLDRFIRIHLFGGHN